MEGERESDGSAAESALCAALAADVDQAFEGVVRHFQDRLFGFALRLTGRREDAEEVAQDAFVRAYRALKSYAPERRREMALKAWLYRIALNVARNRVRRKRRPTVSLDDEAGQAAAARHAHDDPAGRPDARFELKRRRADIASLVAELPERYRAPLILRYVEGLKLEEVAGILKQPVGTTKSNVHRAVNALRNALTDSRRGAKA
ncbi:MAG TPA: sigma-70 family RNA polymerase sigma factor [Thermoanaerobaculia bacterium]|nr:sigma-70 family RNA polymerase sigma factor [Thermoanaerobaculia bacterium]